MFGGGPFSTLALDFSYERRERERCSESADVPARQGGNRNCSDAVSIGPDPGADVVQYQDAPGLSRGNDGLSEVKSGPRVLVVEDEAQIRYALRRYLESNGYQVRDAEDGTTALREFDLFKPDVLLLDLMLPDMSGVDIVRQLRQSHGTPIVVVSAVGDERTKVNALDEGADDYLTKPFGMEELLARLRVALRHATRTANRDARITVGDLVIDLDRRLVSLRGNDVHLTPTEYSLLKYLAVHAGKVLTHTMILNEVWGAGYSDTAVLRTCMNQLRAKLDDNAAKPLIRTEPRIGYRLLEPDGDA
jgi:two-component system KDP operon response regulator KdpE